MKHSRLFSIMHQSRLILSTLFLTSLTSLLFSQPSPTTTTSTPKDSLTMNADGQIVVRLPDIGVFDAVVIYEKLTGQTAILPADIDSKIRLTIMAPKPIPVEEAIHMISSALLLNGYALVPDGSNRVKVVPVNTVNLRSQGLPLYTGPADSLPNDLAVITYFMPFQNLSAKEADEIFRQHVSLNAPYGAIVPIPSSHALLITENVAVIRKLIELRDIIDVPAREVAIEFVQLVSASASTVVDLINDMLKNEGGSNESMNLSLGDGQRIHLTAADLKSKRVRLLPDNRTNRILVSAPRDHLALLVSLIHRLDESAEIGEPTEFHLRYVSASEALPILKAALIEPEADGSIKETNLNQQDRNRTSGTDRDVSGSKDVTSRVQVDQQATLATSVVVGKNRLIADNRTNTILVIGPPQSSLIVRKVLDIVDRPPKQVYLATVIGQMSNTGSQELGVDILHKFRGGEGFGAAGITRTFNVQGPLDPYTIGAASEAMNQVGSGLSVFGVAGHTLNFYVRALQETNRFSILSRPSVYTSNNKKAIISSGTQQPVPGTTQSNIINSNNNSGNSTVLNTTVEYKDVVLELAVVPLINANNEVTLHIAQRNDSLGENVQIGNTLARAINTQELTTSITVPNGQTVVLGGLLTDREDQVRTGVPLLSDIPLLGALFSNTRNQKTKSELVILIQPIVIESPEQANEASLKQMQQSAFSNELLRFMDQPFGALRDKSSTANNTTSSTEGNSPSK
jgi:general secretion pathway protein D